MRLSGSILATAALALILVTAFNRCAAQVAAPGTGVQNTNTPKVELFVGYSYLRATPTLAEGNRLEWLNGGSTSVAYNFSHYLGVVGDFGGFNDTRLYLHGTGGSSSSTVDSSGTAYTYLFGPRLSFRGHGRITPFAQALFGGIHASDVTLSKCTGSCMLLPAETSFAMTAGGGLDIKVRHHLAIRIIQAEYLMTSFNDLSTGKSATQNDVRLSSGVVFRFGGNLAPALPPLGPLTYSCSLTPSSVFSGDPIAASGTAVSLNPAKTAVYTWSVDGGTITGVSDTARIDTSALAPGAYTLKGHVSEGGKPSENADCTAPYVVKAFEPLTVSCVANPSNLISGQSSTITATAVSPQNRPLTYSYNSTSGSVSGVSSTATLSTAGASIGPITVTCNVADDKGQTALGTTLVTVAVPVAAPRPTTSSLCSIGFKRDARRPSRVDNEAKACLDEIALDLQKSSDTKLAIVGNAGHNEKGASARAVNTKTYLVKEKGIDPSRINLYTGSQDEKTVSSTLIPVEATFDATGATPVE
jgi:opacity protein-like surface antigen